MWSSLPGAIHIPTALQSLTLFYFNPHTTMIKCVLIQINAQDIWDNSYTNAETCPITRAVRAAGIEENIPQLLNAMDEGTGIYLQFDGNKYLLIDESDPTYVQMRKRVVQMRHYVCNINIDDVVVEKPKTFIVELALNFPEGMLPHEEQAPKPTAICTGGRCVYYD